MNNTDHAAFKKLDDNHIATLNLNVETYQHQTTGALHYHLNSDNPENVFLVGLRTVPTDSAGSAHILEHTVLCGSKNYPVRDPFFMMIRRSLNTFMNAFTSSDWTAYPFASLNKADFNNLLDVYLDAVFFPTIHPLDFAQEGHRLEFEEAKNAASSLMYKGVVYNEMKGAMSSPTSFVWQKFTSHIYPDTTYHYNSGGDPAVIPSLTYEQLQKFYATHYHPSNAVFFTFGNIPAAEHQAKIHTQALQHFDKSPDTVVIKRATRFIEPKAIVDFFPADANEDKQHVLLGWLLGESSDLYQQLTAVLLSSALLDNSASPLRFVLENTKLGRAPSPLCGLEESNKEMVFVCGLEGAEADKEDDIQRLIIDVMQDVAENGIEQSRLEAVLHQIELSQKEITGGGYPYGMQIILEMLPQAVHDGDPVAAINLDDVLKQLNESIKNPQFIKDLVNNLLLNNPHRLHMSLKPDKDLEAKQQQAEKSRLEQLQLAMTDADKQAVIEQTIALKQRQEQIDDESVLPKVGLADVPAEMFIATGENVSIAGLKGKRYIEGTNTIVYEQIVMPIPALEPEELALLPLYTHCLCELGVTDKSYLEMQTLMDSHTGGINCSTSMRCDVLDENKSQSFLVFSGKSLARKQHHLIELILEFLLNARFDELERIKDLVAQWRVRKENSITAHGHILALMAASRGMSPLAAYAHQTRGLLGITQVKQWDDSFNDNSELTLIAERLAALHRKLQATEKQFLLVGDEASMATLLSTRQNYYSPLAEASNQSSLVLPILSIASDECWTTNTQVNFCAKSYKAVAPYHKDGAAFMVLGEFLRNGFLHRVIREQGGAYGGGASYDSDAGAFRFYSYRDPRMAETFADFDQSIDWLLTNQHGDEKLEEAILGVIGGIDKPSSPAGEANSAFYNELFGRTAEKRQKLRRQILQTSISDLKFVADKYLKPEAATSAVLTSPGNWEKQGMEGMTIKAL